MFFIQSKTLKSNTYIYYLKTLHSPCPNKRNSQLNQGLFTTPIINILYFQSVGLFEKVLLIFYISFILSFHRFTFRLDLRNVFSNTSTHYKQEKKLFQGFLLEDFCIPKTILKIHVVVAFNNKCFIVFHSPQNSTTVVMRQKGVKRNLSMYANQY